jgi:GAF domain-containing protein
MWTLASRAIQDTTRMRETASAAIQDAVRMRETARQALQEAIQRSTWLVSTGKALARPPSTWALTDSRGVSSADRRTLLTTVLDEAIALMGADMGNIQLFDPILGALLIEAQRGFQPPFLEHFSRVHKGEAACGMVLQRAQRIIIQDVADSPMSLGTQALEVLLDAGVRGVQSTPLVSTSGCLLGVLSTHVRRPRRPHDRTLQRLDILSWKLSRVIEQELYP